MSTYSYWMFMYLHRAIWHSSATLTKVFPCIFLSCKANARVKPAKTGHGPHSSKLFVLFCILFVSCRSVYCVCVCVCVCVWCVLCVCVCVCVCADVYCTAATEWLPNCSSKKYIIIWRLGHEVVLYSPAKMHSAIFQETVNSNFICLSFLLAAETRNIFPIVWLK